jgi:hypothetical protein
VDTTLVGGSIDSQAQMAWDADRNEFLAHLSGAVSRWDVNGTFRGTVSLVGYGTQGTESSSPQNHGIAWSCGVYLTYDAGVVSAWDTNSGVRLDTATLVGAGTGVDSHFGYSFANRRFFVLDAAGGSWRGYPVMRTGHLSEPFVQDAEQGWYCSGGVEQAHYKYYGELTFDECQDQANRTGTGWFHGSSSPYPVGWIADQDAANAVVIGASWMTEEIRDRNLTASCNLALFDDKVAPTLFPPEQIYTDGQGRTWHFWDLQGQSSPQAIAFAQIYGARIINPNSVGQIGLVRNAPTHWCYAAAELNGSSFCNGLNTVCDWMVGYYE